VSATDIIKEIVAKVVERQGYNGDNETAEVLAQAAQAKAIADRKIERVERRLRAEARVRQANRESLQ
jgi:hypothetical protein